MVKIIWHKKVNLTKKKITFLRKLGQIFFKRARYAAKNFVNLISIQKKL